MSTAIDEIVKIVQDGLEVGDAVLLADVLSFLRGGRISFTESDINAAITRLQGLGIKVEHLGSPARTRFMKST